MKIFKITEVELTEVVKFLMQLPMVQSERYVNFLRQLPEIDDWDEDEKVQEVNGDLKPKK